MPGRVFVQNVFSILSLGTDSLQKGGIEMRRAVPLAVVLLCGLAPWARADGGAPAGRHLAEAEVDLVPRPKARGRDLVPVSVAADVATKLAVLEAFREAGITKSELGRRIKKNEKEVRRILNPKHPTKLPALTATLRALGRRLAIGMEKADEAA